MTNLEALILGLVQGLTEFLPVSSSGHIELGSYLLNVEGEDHLLFSIIVHGATALSTLVVFRKDIWTILKGALRFEYNDSSAYVAKIVLSMIPIGIVGVLFEEQIEAFFGGRIILVGAMLLITALFLTFTYFKKAKEGEVTYTKAILIGLAQCIAIMPGISRSGTTISVALLLGIDREKATRFSFLMVVIPILGAAFLKSLKISQAPELASGIAIETLIIGFIAAFTAGLFACQWMIQIVKKGKLIYFAFYCIVVGAIAIISGLV